MSRTLCSTALTLLLLLAAAPAFAQTGLYSYFRGGLTSSTLTGDVTGDPGDRRGLHAGLGVRFLVTDTFGGLAELNYTQRGLTRKDDQNTRAIGAESMTYALNYWQLNMMLHAGLPKLAGLRPALQAGAAVNFETAERLTIEGGPDAGESNPETMDSIDLTSVLGVNVDFGDDEDSHWFADARVEKSVMSIADPLQFIGQETPSIKNRTYLLSVGFKWRSGD
ncbi:MAG: PorT family protein [Candidatus Eisenbacteria bacterium]|uniref:PorT family protein n=1 Tax=Eiseniibacteriota bacterium TaxID=2212470 RepID=A0A933S946_UNCEI|nr:PorT family protein [Candidatus Eisenbacteria bacterium]